LAPARARDRDVAFAVLRLLDGVVLPPPQSDVATARFVIRRVAVVAGELRPWLDRARSAGGRRHAGWLPAVDRYATHATVEVARWAPYVTTYAASWTLEHANRFRAYIGLLEDARREALSQLHVELDGAGGRSAR
jgi:hypothetical protein